MGRRWTKSMLKLAVGLFAVAAFATIPTGCAAKKCGACCKKPCGKKCPPGCTKPCCKKKGDAPGN